MNTLLVVLAGAVVIYLAYNFYAKRIDRDVIQANDKKATPAKMYMDGVDFMPASRNVRYAYHFKSIAAAGPIVGVITAANLWGWLPAILWLLLGVSFIRWGRGLQAIHLSAAHARGLFGVYLLLPAADRWSLRRHSGGHPGRAPGRAVRHPDAGADGSAGQPDAVQVEDEPAHGNGGGCGR